MVGARPPATVGTVPVTTVEQTVPADPAFEPGTGTAPTPEPTATAATSAGSQPPVRIRIDAIGVDASVVPVGLEAGGEMEIPQDIQTVGWYEPGIAPGAAGTAVLAGHVDSRRQGRGAFFDLRALDIDDVISVDHRAGEVTHWRVTGRTTYPKQELPIADIFTRFGPTRLVLITCGGSFDSDTRHYTENVVVYTQPAD